MKNNFDEPLSTGNLQFKEHYLAMNENPKRPGSPPEPPANPADDPEIPPNEPPPVPNDDPPELPNQPPPGPIIDPPKDLHQNSDKECNLLR